MAHAMFLRFLSMDICAGVLFSRRPALMIRFEIDSRPAHARYIARRHDWRRATCRSRPAQDADIRARITALS